MSCMDLRLYNTMLYHSTMHVHTIVCFEQHLTTALCNHFSDSLNDSVPLHRTIAHEAMHVQDVLNSSGHANQ